MELAQEEKAARLQHAVINSSVGEISKIYEELGYVEMTAPALGLACRFRGLDMVRALVDRGATFDFPSTEEIEVKYRCHIGEQHAGCRANYRTNYALYLLKAFRGGLKGACCLKGMKFTKNAKQDDGNSLPFLADDERAGVLGYLLSEKEKLSFQPEEMLFYAIFARDAFICEELRRRGVRLSEKRVHTMVEGSMAADGYWHEFCTMTGKLADKDYMEVMQQLSDQIQGKPFYFTEKIYEITRQRFYDTDIFEYFLAHFRQEKMKKFLIIRGLIDENAVGALAVIEREGWLAAPKKRDEMIAYASQNGKTEVLAWLLDFKNRTADFAAEQERADKKLMRELNAAPDSFYALKKIWGCRKEEDGTLTITSYKGTDTEVTVPEKIGKYTVAGIGKRAFTGAYYYSGRAVKKTEHIEHHRTITRIQLPGTIRHIGKCAFHNMSALEEINIPEGLKEIGEHAFSQCRSLRKIVIPGSAERIGEGAFRNVPAVEIDISMGVREIGDHAFTGCNVRTLTIPQTVEKIGSGAFANCGSLETVCICEGVQEIGESAFMGCPSLKHLTIPGTVRCIKNDAFCFCNKLECVEICEGVAEIGMNAFFQCRNLREVRMPKSVRILQTRRAGDYKSEVFDECPNLTVICPKGSRAEAYCNRKCVRYQNCEDD